MLFIVKSNNQNQGIFRFMEEGDKIILIQDGTLLVHNQNNNLIKSAADKKMEILVLKNDLVLRGLKNNAGAKETTYEAMIELIEINTVFS